MILDLLGNEAGVDDHELYEEEEEEPSEGDRWWWW